LDALKHFVTYIPQDDAFDDYLTIEENMDFAAAIRSPHLSNRDRARRVESKLVELGLAERRDSLVGSAVTKLLSGGERKRLNIGLDMLSSADVFLFDEPFGALDEITRERLNDELLRLFQIEGFAGLFITHSIAEAVYMSTRVLVMSPRPGRITASFDVPFAYPRSHDLRYSPEFAELCGEVSHALRGEQP
jgi:NitT/TauT family transport system ATP-binding protein